MTRLLLLAALLLTVSVAPAWAADAGCGVDTDSSGGVDRTCPEICGDGLDNDQSAGAWTYSHTAPVTGDATCTGLADNDHDGYATADDCDDNNRYVFPGEWTTSGCTGGQARKCQAGGSYTSCRTFSSSDCEATGSGVCYCVNTSTGNDSNDGIYDGSPSCWASMAPVSTGCSGITCVTPAAGSVIYLSGTLNTNLSGKTNVLALNGLNGTADNPITFRTLPGSTFTIVNPNSGGTYGRAVEVEASSYLVFNGFEIKDGQGIQFFIGGTSSRITLRRMHVHDMSGQSASNHACVYLFTGASYNTVENSLIYDCYDNSGAGEQIGSGIIAFKGTNNTFRRNVVFGAEPSRQMRGINYKHGSATDSPEYAYNIIQNVHLGMGSNAALTHMHHNLVSDCNDYGVRLADFGGETWLVDMLVENNTFVNCRPFTYSADADDNVGAITFRKNIYRDTWRTSYSGENGVLRVCYYCTDALYTTIVTGGLLSFTENLYSNPNTANFSDGFDLWTASGGYGSLGQTHTFTQWTAAGYDSGSYEENPTFAAGDSFTPTSTNSTGKGWLAAATSTTSTTTSTSSTTSTTAVPPTPLNRAFNRPRFYRIGR